MRKKQGRLMVGIGLAIAMIVGVAVGDDWARFRGPNGAGVAVNSTIPSEWSNTENMQWSVNLPGPGSSCPIVIGDHVLVTCYSGYGTETTPNAKPESLTRHLFCIDSKTGGIVWQKDIKAVEAEDPYDGFIKEHGYASSTPTSDGEHIFAFFSKSGMYAFDMKGNELWHKSLGNFSDPAKWGGGSSPVLYKDTVIVNAGNVGHAIVALNKKNGEVVWEIKDEKFTNCWSTPIFVEVDGHTEMVFSMPGKILAIDPENGAELWTCTSPIAETVCASLAEYEGVVFAMGGRGGVAVGVRCGGKGDVSETHKVWETRLRAGIGTPVAYNGNLYWHSSGKMNCASCKDGTEVYQEAFPGETNNAEPRRGPAGDYASPIIIGDKIFAVMRSGMTHVVGLGEKFELAKTNKLDGDAGPFNATPAVSSKQLFIRSNNKLYCIGAK